MNKQWGIRYGVLGDKIAFQLAAQNIHLPLEMCEHWEKMRDALNTLRLSGIITDGESDKATKRLHKRIEKQVNKKYGDSL